MVPVKNPNGYGSVVRLSGKRRRPYVVRKTVGWNEKKQPVYQILGYYTTREDGLIALAEYNKQPYNLADARLTLGGLHERWQQAVEPTLSPSLCANLRSAYRHIRKLEKMPYRAIRSFHMQDCIDTCGRGYATQAAIKNLWGHLDRFAMELDIISKMYSTLIRAAPVEETHRRPFIEEEIALLWAHKSEPGVDCVLIMLYSGWRITEFVHLETAQINLEAQTMTGGAKTRSGRNRVVPIHPLIRPLIEARYRKDSVWFLSDGEGKPYSEKRFRRLFHQTLQRYGLAHTPHETRHTFRSRLDSAGANKKCIDLMMGHKSPDVGERVYTHKTLDELREALALVTR